MKKFDETQEPLERDHETTILHILGTEILGLFQIDLLSNFRLEMTTEHFPALSRSLFCCFLAIRMRLILKYRNFFEKEKNQFCECYYWMITVIFLVAYNYIISKFFMKKPSLFIIKKRLVWRLSDFSSVFNLPGISVSEPKFYCKFQISNS